MGKEIAKHKWTFFKAGGSWQPAINSADDVRNLAELDQNLWSALACPSRGLACDAKLLADIDSDDDGRIRRDEIVAAAQWACSRLKDPESLFTDSDSVALSNINDSDDDGKTLLASAKNILKCLGKPDADSVAVSDFDDPSKIYANSLFNADGIIVQDSCPTDDLKKLFAEIAAASTPKTDRSGKNGIDASDIQKFFDDITAFANWLEKRKSDTAVAPLGDATASAFAALSAVRQKLDDFFTRADIIAFDPSSLQAVNPDAQQFAKILDSDVSPSSESLKALPAATVEADGILNFDGAVNPAWRKQLQTFRELVLVPVLGTSETDKCGWEKIKAAFAPYELWIAEKPDSPAAQLSPERVSEIASKHSAAELLELVEKDNAAAPEVAGFANVEKLARLNKSLVPLLRNFVSFQDFYQRNTAVFQFGNLYLDSRVFQLCIRVDDIAKHSAMAALAYGYLLYCVCKRKGQADMNLAVLVSAGDSDNLIVGRNGIFYDRCGNDWDATVVKITDNPIGIGQAFFSPYKRCVKWASEQVAKRAASADSTAVSNITDGKLLDTKNKKIDVGTVAALGVAVGGITTAFGALLNAIFGLGWWIPAGLFGILLAISLPSVIIAWLKLRMRNLAPLLDGNGWAVNGKATVNITFGAHLTKTAHLPPNARKQ